MSYKETSYIDMYDKHLKWKVKLLLIKLDNASVTYTNHHSTIYALKDVSTTIAQGEWVNILGPSGSGKTTLLNIIGGQEKISSGSVEVDNKNLSSLTEDELQIYRRETVGYIFQDFRLFEQFSVLDNIMLPQWPYQSKKILEEKAKSLLDKLKLSHRYSSLPGELSGGEKQRTAIARALINNPKILLCDEPTGNLDRDNSENILEILDDLNKKGITLLLVTHDLEIVNWGSKKLYLRDGILGE